MKYILLFWILFMGNLSAKGADSFEIKIGNAILKGIMPGKRSSSAPDIPVRREFDICSWLDDKKNQKHNAQKELLRKLWDFKRFFKAPSGSLIFTVSFVNNKKYGNDLKSYYDGVAKAKLEQLKSFTDRDYTDHNYTPAEGYKEFELDGHSWMVYYADNKSVRFYRTFLNDNIVLRINLIQSDNRKNAVKIIYWENNILNILGHPSYLHKIHYAL
jgi:hypothetical protein